MGGTSPCALRLLRPCLLLYLTGGDDEGTSDEDFEDDAFDSEIADDQHDMEEQGMAKFFFRQ